MASNDDVLGLDEQLTVTKRVKIPKIDQERLLGKNGVSYIIKDHQKVNRIIKRNDQKNKSASRKAKYDVEYQNLTTVLQFYQLWCHTLFPKAKFYDCVQLIRGVTNRSPMLKLYRRDLLEREISKAKESMGMLVVPDIEEPAGDRPSESRNDIVVGNDILASDIAAANDVEEEDDYNVPDFEMIFGENGLQKNPLFVDPDGDIYGDSYGSDTETGANDPPIEPHYNPPATQQTQPETQTEGTQTQVSQSQPDIQQQTEPQIQPETQPEAQTQPQIQPQTQTTMPEDEEAFSDEDQFLSAADIHLKTDPKPPVLNPVLDPIEIENGSDDHDEEWAIMNELSM